MTQVVSLRLHDEQVERVRRLALRRNRTISETSAALIEEGLRMAEFAFIQFRDSPAGRQAYILGSSLAVWEVVRLAQAYGGDVARTAAHLEWPEVKVQAALNYAASYPDEIQAAIDDNHIDFAELSRLLPGAERFAADEPDTADRANIKNTVDSAGGDDEAPAR